MVTAGVLRGATAITWISWSFFALELFDLSKAWDSFGLAAAHRGKPQRLGDLTRAECSRSWSSFGLASARRGKPQRLGDLTRAECSRSWSSFGLANARRGTCQRLGALTRPCSCSSCRRRAWLWLSRCARPRRSRTLLRTPLASRGPPPGAAAGASWAADPSRLRSSFGLAAVHRGRRRRLGQRGLLAGRSRSSQRLPPSQRVEVRER